jgi:cell volume regulation protein A
VPIVFATYPLIAGIPKAELIFNLVFFISITSVLLQGTTLASVAKLLHVTVPAKAKKRIGLDFETNDSIKSEMREVLLPADSTAVSKRIVDLNIPATINILAIRRAGLYITPHGSTKLQANDTMVVLAEDQHALELLIQNLDVELAD